MRGIRNDDFRRHGLRVNMCRCDTSFLRTSLDEMYNSIPSST